MAETTGYKAGKKRAESIVEDANLMHNNRTASHYLQGVKDVIDKEMYRRRRKRPRRTRK